MGNILKAILGLVLGYAAGVGLVALFSANTHDKSLETVMTAFFAAGPLGAVIGLVAGIVWARRSAGANRARTPDAP